MTTWIGETYIGFHTSFLKRLVNNSFVSSFLARSCRDGKRWTERGVSPNSDFDSRKNKSTDILGDWSLQNEFSNLLLMIGFATEAREKCWFWWYCWLPAGPDRVCWTGGRATTGVLPRLVNALDVRMASACFWCTDWIEVEGGTFCRGV